MLKYLIYILSPTYLISTHYKQNAYSITDRGKRVQFLNTFYLKCSLFIVFSLHLIYYLNFKNLSLTLLFFSIYYTVSRAHEIFMAFLKDAFDKLNKHTRSSNGLTYKKRVQMALRSYLELNLNYAILFYIIDQQIAPFFSIKSFFNQPLNSFFDAFYFSTITLLSIGYGDIHPIHPISKILVCYEAITGTLLLVVSFTIYVNLSLKE